MFNRLKPPTDNLYKFISIAGLICFVLGVVLVVQTIRKTLDVAYAGEDALHEAWLALGEGFKDGDDETAFDILNEAWEKGMQGEDPFGLTQELRKLGTLSDEQIAAVRRFEIAIEAFGDQHQLQKTVAKWLGVLIGGALLTVGCGFVLWYRKTQRYQDILLRMQTEEQTPVEERDEPANAGRKWTPEEEDKLRKGFGEKKRYKALAKAHGRTPGAIKARLNRLGLKTRGPRRKRRRDQAVEVGAVPSGVAGATGAGRPAHRPPTWRLIAKQNTLPSPRTPRGLFNAPRPPQPIHSGCSTCIPLALSSLGNADTPVVAAIPSAYQE